jgi:bifunctional DNA-binding transcriptional regulator/antitoxin component of YhaV-PrlF toxin-antitoxin module
MGTSSVIAVPKPIVDGFGLEKGQKLEVFVTDRGIYIPLKPRELGIEDALNALSRIRPTQRKVENR